MPAPRTNPPDMSPAAFRAWLARSGMTQGRAAVALGRGRTTVIRYLNGDLPIDRTVALACWAIEHGAPMDAAPYDDDGTIRA